MPLPPPNLNGNTDPKVKEYLRRLWESHNALENHVKSMLSHPVFSPAIPSSLPPTVIVEQVQGLGQASQGQFTYAPVVLALPPVGDPLRQNGQIVFLDVAGSLVGYVFNGINDPGIWMTISTMTAMAVPSCLAFNSINQSIPNTTETLLTYDSEVYDTNGIHSTSSVTGRLTAQTAGKYSITLNLVFSQNNTGIRFGSIRLNGSTLIGAYSTRAINDGATRTFVSINAQYVLAVGDYVDSTAYQDSGGALNVEATGKEPNFGMVLVST